MVFYVLYREVKTVCGVAVRKFEGDCVEALQKQAVSEEMSFKERNQAIWTLGQLADKRALPILYRLKKDGPMREREPLDETISQYEIVKAIRWCENGNWVSWMY